MTEQEIEDCRHQAIETLKNYENHPCEVDWARTVLALLLHIDQVAEEAELRRPDPPKDF